MYAFAGVPLDEFVRERHVGERVNPHVVRPARIPGPDFDAMKRTLEGKADSSSDKVGNETREDRNISESDRSS